MPGSNARAIEKAKTLPVDGVILDLEDAVAPDAKEAARARSRKRCRPAASASARSSSAQRRSTRPGFPTISTRRSRPARTPSWCRRFRRREHLEMIGQRLLDIHADHAHPALGHDRDAGRDLQHPRRSPPRRAMSESRLGGFVIGTNDLAKETRARLVPGRAPMLPWLATCVLAARSLRHRHPRRRLQRPRATPRASRANARRAATWASTARR